ncbi:UNVERIFIED_CONTAM: hypothetical protein Sangu_3229700 [Sesamum angustifolium]|uniref:Reverse transcriptase domain-containing protein n=1 Tax=Sesamum angustifolium TaxID=2727405 RepID=A0AAW2JHC2_9LAMI
MDIVFSIDKDSVAGPDGFSSAFFQKCWDFIKYDIQEAVRDFFCGTPMPRSFKATTIVLIPKVESPQTWSDFRPISLCNVTNKILSKLLYKKLSLSLPNLISPSQSGFVTGRLISDNILMAQEMIHHLDLRYKNSNLVIKLDMSKAFFQIHAGAKTRRPDISSLFIIAAEALSKGIDHLFNGNPDMYFQAKCEVKISHLSYADDVIIFTNCKEAGLLRLMNFLRKFEEQSGQQINQAKSAFIPGRKANLIANRIKNITGFSMKALPITYLGAPLYKGNKRKALYENLIDKVRNRISGWENCHLSYGGRLLLIKTVLSSMPIYLLQVLNPPVSTIQKLERLFARFFWGSTTEQRKIHWTKWHNVCFPTDEGGLGIRNLRDVVSAFSYKLWWRLRLNNSLWSTFTISKYCQGYFREPPKFSQRTRAFGKDSA